jgi:hypothetical protein
MEANWKVKLTLDVQGPKEGAVVTTIEYLSTTKEMAVLLQNKLAELGISLNKGVVR